MNPKTTEESTGSPGLSGEKNQYPAPGMAWDPVILMTSYGGAESYVKCSGGSSQSGVNSR